MEASKFAWSQYILYIAASGQLFAKAGGIGVISLKRDPSMSADDLDGSNCTSFRIFNLVPRNKDPPPPPPEALYSTFVSNDCFGPE
jgi:hypothetical protein